MSVSTYSRRVTFFLFCIKNNHKFALDIERREDITLSHMTDVLQSAAGAEQGFVVFRDRSFVECPYCKSLCHLIPGTAIISADIKYTPPKD
jgi:hypothetical protein